MAYTTDEINEAFDKIMKAIENGKPLRRVLNADNQPSSQTFYKWIDEDEEKSKRYVRACEARAETIFEDILQIADGEFVVEYVDTIDVLKDDDGNVIETIEATEEVISIRNNDVKRNQIMIDARKWMLGKMNPKKYGDKTILEGGDPDKPIIVDFTD